MFDTHCHLNFKTFRNNFDQVIKDAFQVGVKDIVIPGTDIQTSKKAIEIAEKYDGVFVAVGIHPHHANVGADFMSAHLQEIEKLILHPKVVAIGEVGIDKHQYSITKHQKYIVNNQFVQTQKDLLVRQIKLAIKYKKSLILHNREAKTEILEILTANWDNRLEGRAVFHCCEPDKELLDFAIKHHIFIGVDGDVTYNREKQEFIKKVPLDLLVLETDSPYLLPEPLKSQKLYPNKPANISILNQFVADLRHQSADKMAELTTLNSKSLFSPSIIY